MTEIMHLWRQRFFRRLLEMPRNQKRLLMVLADLVCIPAALWTAMTLKQGTPLHASLDDSWLYLAAIMASVPVFVRLGLYRAVVRFLGTRALLTVVTGVSVSVGLLLIVNQLMLGKGVHISTFAIYWALALIYVGGSRMVARALIHVRRLRFRPRCDLWRRCRRRTGGERPARQRTLLPGRFHRRQQGPAGQQHQRHRGLRPERSAGADCATTA